MAAEGSKSAPEKVPEGSAAPPAEVEEKIPMTPKIPMCVFPGNWVMVGVKVRVRDRLRLRLGGGVGGSVLVATPDSVHSAFCLG